MSKSIPQHQEHDPYLVPGVICEVWDFEDFKRYYKFSNFNDVGIPFFDINKNYPVTFLHYRPVGTEWDYSPDWAVCSTVEKHGLMRFWIDIPSYDLIWFIENRDHNLVQMTIGFCPDKTRYEGDAWKTSLRMRPDWVKVG